MRRRAGIVGNLPNNGPRICPVRDDRRRGRVIAHGRIGGWPRRKPGAAADAFATWGDRRSVPRGRGGAGTRGGEGEAFRGWSSWWPRVGKVARGFEGPDPRPRGALCREVWADAGEGRQGCRGGGGLGRGGRGNARRREGPRATPEDPSGGGEVDQGMGWPWGRTPARQGRQGRHTGQGRIGGRRLPAYTGAVCAVRALGRRKGGGEGPTPIMNPERCVEISMGRSTRIGRECASLHT